LAPTWAICFLKSQLTSIPQGIGHTHLVSLLLPLLLKTRQQTGVPSRVITTSSFGHIVAIPGGIDYDNYEKPVDERVEYLPAVEYGISKWANVAMARYLDVEYGKKGDLISIPVHPGQSCFATL
jgi:NAD(P)-dependent dehydrogenase (short-subunit alcohol dehydrogenase family)